MNQATFPQLLAIGSGLVTVATFVVLPLAVLFTVSILQLFRRRVALSMRSTAGGDIGSEARTLSLVTVSGKLELEVVDVTRERARISRKSRMLLQVRHRAFRLAGIVAIAACAPPLGEAAAWASISGDHSALAGWAVYFGVFFLVCSTPVALAFVLVFQRQTRYLCGAVAAVLLILWASGRISGLNPLGTWFYIGCVPTVFVLLLNGRRLRAVAPLVLAATTVLVSGISIGVVFATYQIWDVMGMEFVREDLAGLPYFQAGFKYTSELWSLPAEERLAELSRVTSDPLSVISPSRPDTLTPFVLFRFWLTSLIALLLSGTAAWGLMRWFARNYDRSLASDKMLTIDAVILVFTLWYLLILASSEPLYLFVLPASFVAYMVLSRWLLHRRKVAASPTLPQTLLLLRVFGFRRRSQRLLEDLGDYWRYLGPIRLIGGPDLVDATIEPHEFFEFLNGRLSRAFVINEDDLDSRVTETVVSDLDGLFRIEDFFCHDDTWRMTVARLANKADAIAMDLRGFTAASRGCELEIEQLVATFDLRRVVLLVDQTTDMSRLDAAVQEAWQRIPVDSPNRSESNQRIRVLRSSHRHGDTLDCLLGLLCQDLPSPARSG